MDTYEINGRSYPVLGTVPSKVAGCYISLLEVKLMDDDEWTQMCRSFFLEKYEAEFGAQPSFPEPEYEKYCAELRAECADVPESVICYA